MKNKEIADLLYEIADLLEMQDVEWKPRAYRRAARSVEALSEPIEDVAERGDLKEIDGVGEGIGKKIQEYLETGHLEYYEELKGELPLDIEALSAVEGIGPKTARKLYKELNVKTLDDLEDAAKNGEIAELEGFGEKTQENILSHIEAARRGEERMLLGKAFPIAEHMQEKLADAPEFSRVKIVGSFRRRRPTVGDIDILATADDPDEAMNMFCTMDDVKEVLNQGSTKSSIIVSGGLQIDLRIVEDSSWGAALVYFTGSKDHNITLRRRAIDRDWKLNEYGLFDVNGISSDDKRAGDLIAGGSEEGVYDALDLAFISPELREDTGEVQRAADHNLPDLVEQEDICGDLQMHTRYSDGNANVEDMAAKADELGYDYILITDHGPALHVAGGPGSVDDLEEQAEDIAAANETYDVQVLHGMEVNITDDGIDVSQEMLDQLDLVVAAMHDRLENPTEKIVSAFKEYPIDIFAHPLNRMIGKREPADIDLDRIITVADEEQIALEINSQPGRLDLPWDLVKQCRDRIMFVVSTDAHTPGEMEFMHLGVAQARRGWCEPGNILNTRSLDGLNRFFT